MREALLVGLGGFAGAISRYLMAGLIQRLAGSNFPYGTLTVNILGAFSLGLLLQWLALSSPMSGPTRLALAIGFLGSFTTFSTYAVETLQLGISDRLPAALLYSVGSLLLGIVMAGAGMGAGRLLFRA